MTTKSNSKLKGFNVSEKYNDILPYLETKKNQSSFICELILKEMYNENTDLNIKELQNNMVESITKETKKVIDENLRNVIIFEIRYWLNEYKGEIIQEVTKRVIDLLNPSLEKEDEIVD